MVTHQEISGMSSKNPKYHTLLETCFQLQVCKFERTLWRNSNLAFLQSRPLMQISSKWGCAGDGCKFHVDHQYHTETQGRLGLVCVQDWCSTLIPSPHKRRAQPRNKVSAGLTSTTVTAGRAPVRNRSCSWLLPPNTRYKLRFLPGCSIDLQAIKEELNRIRIS